MISKIKIRNFKCLKDIELEFSNLNLLTGLNGMGKSAVIQVMLLLKQSYDRGSLARDGLTLKGELVNIGTGKDALAVNATEEAITFELSFSPNGKTYQWIFAYEDKLKEVKYADSDVLPFAEDGRPSYDWIDLPLFNSQFRYLNALRFVTNHYERSDFQVVQKRNLGKHGEYTPHYLAHFGSSKSEEVNSKLLYPGTKIPTLDYQVSAWMNEISPGVKVNASKIKGVDAVKLSYGDDEFDPTNVGFGITYVLPVIVGLLSSRPGDILVLENPESHVHPRGQSAIGRLAGMVAQQGVQVFIESHSDHVLNGICVAIHQRLLDRQLAKLYFINKESKDSGSSKYQIEIDERGRINDKNLKEIGIEGFFDQANKDLATILFA